MRQRVLLVHGRSQIDGSGEMETVNRRKEWAWAYIQMTHGGSVDKRTPMTLFRRLKPNAGVMVPMGGGMHYKMVVRRPPQALEELVQIVWGRKELEPLEMAQAQDLGAHYTVLHTLFVALRCN